MLISIENVVLWHEDVKSKLQEGVLRKRNCGLHLIFFDGKMIWKLRFTG